MKTKKTTSEFRQILAEQGIEMTLEDAEDAYVMVTEIRKTARKLSTLDLWDMEENESLGLSREERESLTGLYRVAKEL